MKISSSFARNLAQTGKILYEKQAEEWLSFAEIDLLQKKATNDFSLLRKYLF
ncbi:MAG: hypothetical protein KAU17_11280 [Spirochaetales bacterium]|jgi:hypothetical protein|nr:hypothetical protein [Spirochaetales bacterium]